MRSPSEHSYIKQQCTLGFQIVLPFLIILEIKSQGHKNEDIDEHYDLDDLSSSKKCLR